MAATVLLTAANILTVLANVVVGSACMAHMRHNASAYAVVAWLARANPITLAYQSAPVCINAHSVLVADAVLCIAPMTPFVARMVDWFRTILALATTMGKIPKGNW